MGNMSGSLEHCVVCDGTVSEPWLEKLRRCSGCGHIYADMSMFEFDPREWYKGDFFKGGAYCDYKADKKTIQKNFRARLKKLWKFVDNASSASLLEIGCAYGFFLEVAQEHFKQVEGIDVTSEGIAHAKSESGLNVTLNDFLEHDYEGRRFEVVCLWDTIEHLMRPDLFLEKVSRISNPDALLAITTGDIDSFNARFWKGKWRLILPPTHIHYFSRKTLVSLVGKYGYEIVDMSHCGFYRSANNVAYTLLALKGRFEGLYRFLKKVGLLNFSFYFNQYDIMYAIARKKKD